MTLYKLLTAIPDSIQDTLVDNNIPEEERCPMCRGYGAIILEEMGRPCVCGGSGLKKDTDSAILELKRNLEYYEKNK